MGDEHEGEIVTKGSQISFKIFCLFLVTIDSFYRVEKIEVTINVSSR